MDREPTLAELKEKLAAGGKIVASIPTVGWRLPGEVRPSTDGTSSHRDIARRDEWHGPPTW
jgi:hypothetical protein